MSPEQSLDMSMPNFKTRHVAKSPCCSNHIVPSSGEVWCVCVCVSRERDMAKASFSAYVLGKNLLKTGEKVYFSTKKSATNFGRPFCSFPFPFFASKWLKYAVFAFQKPKKVGRKRGLHQRERERESARYECVVHIQKDSRDC